MAAGQSVLTSAVLDTAKVDRLCAELEDGERSRQVLHAAQLRRALELRRVLDDAGMGIGAPAQLALLWHCSEDRAAAFLHDAGVLRRLGGLPVMEAGLRSLSMTAPGAQVGAIPQHCGRRCSTSEPVHRPRSDIRSTPTTTRLPSSDRRPVRACCAVRT